MPKDRAGSILEEIEKRQAVPIPRWHFVLRQFAFWALAVFSVLTGSIAMATAMYVFLDNDFIEDHEVITLYFEQQPLVADIFRSIPYLWIGALALFILVAYYGFRHTRKGYRYTTAKVVAASLLASLLISLCLNTVDVGGYIHRYLVENVRGYHRLIYSNEFRWSQASKGRLGGKILAYDKEKGVIVLRTFRKVLWTVDVSKAEVEPGTRLAPGRLLKITGTRTGRVSFRAKEIQAWEKKYKRKVEPVVKKEPEKNQEQVQPQVQPPGR
ncbi:MAG: hypothetical protein HGB20_00365 [Chlorobiaceae bacterium]|nr:hypothetical protein [Chlorobiaceae bacterium]